MKPIALATLCNSFFACSQPVRDETRSGGLHFNDVVQPATVDGLPFAGVGESGCTSAHTHIIQAHRDRADADTPLADGLQALKYSYDEFTYLRSSVDIPLA
jgi:aldehyde dehydrogenase (NAD+)